MNNTIKKYYWWLVLIISLIPLISLIIDGWNNNLGGNPVEAVHLRLGDLSLRFLWLTLAITPLQSMTQWRGMASYRQLLGLYAFFYASLHILAYLVLDQGLQYQMILTDIQESPYILFGVLAYIIITVLAITSPNYAKRRLGKNWKKLHRTIYIAAIAGLLHYFWQLKGDLAEPLFYLVLIIVLFGFRLITWFKNKQFTKLMIPRGR